MQEEIRIKDIWEIINSGKKILIVLTLFVFVLSIITNFWLIKPKFLSSSVVVVNNNKDNTNKADALSAYSQQITSEYITNKIVNILKANHGINLTTEIIKNNITVVPEKNSNFIKISSQNSDSKIAFEVANLLARELAASIEISSRSDTNVDYRKKMLVTEDNINLTESEIKQAKQQLEQTPEKLITNKSLSDDLYFQNKISNDNSDSSKLNQYKIINEEINPVFVSLKNKIADNSVNLSKLITEKENFMNRISENNKVINDLKNTETQNKLTDILTSSEFDSVIITPALESTTPVSPHKTLNITISTIISFIFGLVIIFIRALIIKSKKQYL